MTRQYFGTDGIRGTVGQPPITPDFVLRLAHAVGRVLRRTEERPTVLIGKDTRISGYMFEAALEAGFIAAGVNVSLIGPLPTPGIAYMARKSGCRFGVVISASHNLYQDNGIKFFDANGSKLSDATEESIEALLDGPALTRALMAGAQWPKGFWFGVDSVWLRHGNGPVCAWENQHPEYDSAPEEKALVAQITLSESLLLALSLPANPETNP